MVDPTPHDPASDVGRALFEHTDDVAVVFAFEGAEDDVARVIVEDVNMAFASGFGRTPQELRGRRLDELYPEAEAADVAARCLAATRDGGTHRYTTVRELGDGQRLAEGTIVALGDGRFLAWGRISHRLDDAQTRLHELEALADVGSFVWNLEQRRVSLSPQFRRILGLPDTTPDSRSAVLDQVHPEDRARVAAVVDAAEHHGGVAPTAFRVVAADGAIRHLEGRAEVIRDLRGRPIRVVGNVRDVTAHLLADERARQLQLVAWERERALELNDDVVQGLSQAWLALELGEYEDADAAVRRATLAAQDIVADLLHTTSEEHGEVVAGQLVRRRPSGAIPGGGR